MSEKDSVVKRFGIFTRDNSSLMLLLFMILIGSIVSSSFFSIDNLLNLFRRISVNGIVAAGFTIVLLTGGFDLSVGAILSLTGVILLGLEKTIGSLPAVMIALAIGSLLGFFNGILMKITRGGTGEAFLITLSTAILFNSAALVYTNGVPIYGVKEGWYQALGQGNIYGFPIATLVWLTIMIILQIYIKKTKAGRNLLLSGANKNAAFLAGIDVNNIKLWAFTISGLLATFATIILSSRTTAASSTSGDDATFDAAIAAIIGGNSLIGGRGGMVQVFIGVVIYGLITNILNLAGVNSIMQYVFKGIILIIAIILDNLKKR